MHAGDACLPCRPPADAPVPPAPQLLLRRAMQKPSRFPLALLLGFTTMLITYSATAAAGYW